MRGGFFYFKAETATVHAVLLALKKNLILYVLIWKTNVFELVSYEIQGRADRRDSEKKGGGCEWLLITM